MENMEQYILKIATNDAKGLIYNISKVLFANNLNIDIRDRYTRAICIFRAKCNRDFSILPIFSGAHIIFFYCGFDF